MAQGTGTAHSMADAGMGCNSCFGVMGDTGPKSTSEGIDGDIV